MFDTYCYYLPQVQKLIHCLKILPAAPIKLGSLFDIKRCCKQTAALSSPNTLLQQASPSHGFAPHGLLFKGLNMQLGITPPHWFGISTLA